MADGPELESPGEIEIEVEVIYCASRSKLDSSVLTLRDGASVDDAVTAAGIMQRHPDIQCGERRIGIWGRLVSGPHRLSDGDRVEIYRPLQVEPKEARRLRQRAQSARRVPKPA